MSWRVTDEPHHPWVAVTNKGKVITAHCDCMAGLGESCSPVGALLFKIEAAVRNGYTRLAYTEKPCEWNKCFVKSVTPAPVTSIKLYKDKATERLRECLRTQKPPPAPPLLSEQLGFIHSLESCLHKLIGLSTFKKTAHHFARKEKEMSVRHLPKPHISLYDPDSINLTKDDLVKKCQEILPTFTVSASEKDYLMECTKNQSNSLVWHEQRTGRITASEACSVLHTNMDCPAPSLIRKICNPVHQERKTKPVQWRCLHKATVLHHYTAAISTQNCDVKITRTGLGVCMDKGFIGASPDALFSCSCCCNAVVEIKCPYTLKDATVDDISSATNNLQCY